LKQIDYVYYYINGFNGKLGVCW